MLGGVVVGAAVGGVVVVGVVVGGLVGEVGGAVGVPPCRTTTWFPGAKLTWLVHNPAGAAELASAVIVTLPPPGILPELWLKVIQELCGTALHEIGALPELRSKMATLSGSAERWLTLTKKLAPGSPIGVGPGLTGGVVVITEPVRAGPGPAGTVTCAVAVGPAVGVMVTASPPSPAPAVTTGSAGGASSAWFG